MKLSQFLMCLQTNFGERNFSINFYLPIKSHCNSYCVLKSNRFFTSDTTVHFYTSLTDKSVLTTMAQTIFPVTIITTSFAISMETVSIRTKSNQIYTKDLAGLTLFKLGRGGGAMCPSPYNRLKFDLCDKHDFGSLHIKTKQMSIHPKCKQ